MTHISEQRSRGVTSILKHDTRWCGLTGLVGFVFKVIMKTMYLEFSVEMSVFGYTELKKLVLTQCLCLSVCLYYICQLWRTYFDQIHAKHHVHWNTLWVYY